MIEVYVLKNDGTLLFYLPSSLEKRTSLENATLFSGIISAIKSFLKELRVGDIKNFMTNENQIFIKSTKELSVVLVLEKNLELTEKTIEDLLNKLSKTITQITKGETIEELLKNNIITKELETKLIVHIEDFQNSLHESKATRKLLDSLW